MQNNFINEEKNKTNPTKLKTILIVFGLVLALVISFLGGYFVRYTSQSETVKLISELTRIIEENAKNQDGTELTKEELAKKLVQVALSEDKYAVYYDAQEYKNLLIEDKGLNSGIGISYYSSDLDSSINGAFKVIWNSPAEKAGIKDGDVIKYGKLSTDTEYTEFNTNRDLLYFLGTTDSDAEINLKIAGSSNVFTVKKQQYTVSYVKYVDCEEMMTFESDEGSLILNQKIDTQKGNSDLDSETAIIKLSLFEGDAASQLYDALTFMSQRGKTKLILDLMDNGGGSLNVLLKIASYLVCGNGNACNRITYAEEKSRTVDYVTTENKYFTNLTNVVILANKYTASASECLIGAMNYDRYYGGKFNLNKLVTTYNNDREDYSTFGKGIMQRFYNLPDGGALKLTTAVLYQPDATTCIHNIGIKSNDKKNYVSSEKVLSRAIEILAE